MGRGFVVKFFKKDAFAVTLFYLLEAALCATFFFYQINDKNTKPARFS